MQDGFVEAKSARTMGSKLFLDKECDNVLDHNVNHFTLPRGDDQTYAILHTAKAKSGELRRLSPGNMYVVIKDEGCRDGDVVVVTGKPLVDEKMPLPVGCREPDGICQIGDTTDDCLVSRPVCDALPIVVYVLLMASIILLIIHIVGYDRRHKRNVEILRTIYALLTFSGAGMVITALLCSQFLFVPLMVGALVLASLLAERRYGEKAF